MISEARVWQGGSFGKGGAQLGLWKGAQCLSPGAEPSAAPLPPALGRGKANQAKGISLDLGTDRHTIRSPCELALLSTPNCRVAMGFMDERMNVLTKRG